VKYTITHVDEPLAPMDSHWTVRTNDLITGVFWFKGDAYDYVAHQVRQRASVLRNYEVDVEP
jgi:hypothetical protein